jgi:nucleoside-diphosphate-sugar epimerase
VYELFDHIKPSITFNLVDFGPEQAEADQARAHQINSDLVLAISEGIAGNRDRSWEGQDIVQLGSAAEYGTEHANWDEESEPLPTTIYGQSKLSGTRFLKNSSRAYGIKSITARVFSVYGPGEEGRGLLPALLATAASGGDLRLRASQVHRDWTYVADVAEGLCRLGLVRSTEPGVVNLASGRWTSVHEFVQHATRALRLSDDKVRLTVEGERGDIKPTSVPLWRLHDLTGWVPTTSTEEGIARTLEFENLLEPKIVERETRVSAEWGGAN